MSRLRGVTLVTVDISAGQAPDQLHFSKYFLLGSTRTARAEFSNGGCGYPQGRRLCTGQGGAVDDTPERGIFIHRFIHRLCYKESKGCLQLRQP
jgi:hypothetical protein